MPRQDRDDVITMQYRAPGEDWVDSDSYMIQEMDIHVGHNYRCVFRDTDEPDNNAESGIIHMVNGKYEVDTEYGSYGCAGAVANVPVL